MRYKTLGFLAAPLLFVASATSGSAFADGISSSGRDGAGTVVVETSAPLALDHAQSGFSDATLGADAFGHSLQTEPVADHILTWTSTIMRFRSDASTSTSGSASQDPVGISEASSFLLLGTGLISLVLFRRRNTGAW
jgi:hypothetical protein